jgi:FMN phosphatase YigB (HAD superfamily)
MWNEISLVRDYRKLYSKGIIHLDRCSVLAQQYQINTGKVEDTIKKWMIDRPLPFIRKFRDQKLFALLEDFRAVGVKQIVYSDYPFAEKLKALGFLPDAAYSADNIGWLKPSPDGLLQILKENGVLAANCLLIGDKFEKDGKCAENSRVDYFILPQSKLRRKKTYTKLSNVFAGYQVLNPSNR